MVKQKNKRGIAADITYTLIVTGLIILLLIIYAIFSAIIKEFSNVQGGVEQKFSDNGADGYLYKYNFKTEGKKVTYSNPETFEELVYHRYVFAQGYLPIELQAFYLQNLKYPEVDKELEKNQKYEGNLNSMMLIGNGVNSVSRFYYNIRGENGE